jgi:hypothetical protein
MSASSPPEPSPGGGQTPTTRPVLERLYREPQRFELFQAVRLLYAEAVADAAAAKGSVPFRARRSVFIPRPRSDFPRGRSPRSAVARRPTGRQGPPTPTSMSPASG